jgi:hypothetical protein
MSTFWRWRRRRSPAAIRATPVLWQEAAETVTSGDPSYAGPLAGVSLGLPVFHILEPALREEIPTQLYEEHLELVSMVADIDGIGKVLEQFRSASSQS